MAKIQNFYPQNIVISLLLIVGISSITRRAMPEHKNMVFIACIALMVLGFIAGRESIQQVSRAKKNGKK